MQPFENIKHFYSLPKKTKTLFQDVFIEMTRVIIPYVTPFNSMRCYWVRYKVF